MLENIKNTLYPEIKNKTSFFIALAKEVDRSPLSLRQHWFANFWSIPEEFQAKVVDFMQKYIKNQD